MMVSLYWTIFSPLSSQQTIVSPVGNNSTIIGLLTTTYHLESSLWQEICSKLYVCATSMDVFYSELIALKLHKIV